MDTKDGDPHAVESGTCAEVPPAIIPPGLWQELIVLTKARLSSLVVMTSIVGYLLAKQGPVRWDILALTVLGVGLLAGAAAVFNQAMEIGPDRLMRRTADRPLAAGRMKPGVAWFIGVLLTLIGTVLLDTLVGRLPAALALATTLIYTLIYTPMKLRSSWCTVVGGIAGALPPVIGWTAGGGGLDAGAASLFAILFFWQMPHFLAINWLYRSEYETAGFQMWSNHDVSGRRTAILALVFSILLIVSACTPLLVGLGNLYYVGVAILLSGGVAALSMVFFQKCRPEDARRLFYATLLYLPLLMGMLVFTSR